MLHDARKPVVFDLDDAVHYIRQSQYPGALNPKRVTDWLVVAYRTIARGNRFYSSRKRLLDQMLAHASVVIAGNRWLFEELSLTETRGMVVPTAVWVNGTPRKIHDTHKPVTLGWIGVRSNLYYLESLEEALRELHARFGADMELKVVSSAPFPTAVETRFVPWSLETEGDEVLTFDIGLMPLQDDPFSRGKCAFKAVFCMSRGVPVVASPVGANNELIAHGKNGYLASNTAEWVDCLSGLIEDATLRAQLGEHARETVEADFSAERVTAQLRDALLRAGTDTPAQSAK
jgi:glycosyltransferase involved in cell wall biosynthesis